MLSLGSILVTLTDEDLKILIVDGKLLFLFKSFQVIVGNLLSQSCSSLRTSVW